LKKFEEPVASDHHGIFFDNTGVNERRQVMALVESCIFYEDSKCMLKGGYCDLDCSLSKNDHATQFYDEIDTFTKWQIEKAKREEINSQWK
jgi:hypothetical protein